MLILKTAAPRLFAGIGTLTLLAGLGLLASRPAHTAGGPIAVSVANTPLAVVTTGGTPFQTEIVPTVEGTFFTASYYLGQITVPAGKRLVLQSLSADFKPLYNPENPVFAVTTLAGGSEGIHNFTATINPNNNVLRNSTAVPEQPMTVYADPGSTVSVRVDNLHEYFGGGLKITLSGYLVDAP